MAAQFAIRLSLITFAVALVRGLIDGADFRGTVESSLIALAVFYGLGLVLGELARRVVEENARAECERMQDEDSTLQVA